MKLPSPEEIARETHNQFVLGNWGHRAARAAYEAVARELENQRMAYDDLLAQTKDADNEAAFLTFRRSCDFWLDKIRQAIASGAIG